MISIDLITGFLGAGKTTFLMKYGDYLLNKGKRIGILTYDLGAVNVDMTILSNHFGTKCELEMVAASCDEECLSRRMRTKLLSMSLMGYDRILIEPSGVFDLDWFLDVLHDEYLEDRLRIDNIIAIVSADIRELTPPEAHLLATQVVNAGCIVFSRTQTVSQERINKAQQILADAIAKLNSTGFTPCYIKKSWENLTESDFDRITALGHYHYGYAKQKWDEKSHESISLLNLSVQNRNLPEMIHHLLHASDLGRILRIKGTMQSDDNCYEINATSNAIQIAPVPKGETSLTLIGTDLNRDKITMFLAGKTLKNYLLG